jgi:hypothetical protein
MQIASTGVQAKTMTDIISFPATEFVFGLYTNLCTDMQNRVRVITYWNDYVELLYGYCSLHLPQYITICTVEKFAN